MADGSPLTLRGDEIVQPKLSIDLLQPKVNGVVVELGLRYAIGRDRGGQSWQLSLGFAPTTTSLTRGVWVNWIGVRGNKGQENHG